MRTRKGCWFRILAHNRIGYKQVASLALFMLALLLHAHTYGQTSVTSSQTVVKELNRIWKATSQLPHLRYTTEDSIWSFFTPQAIPIAKDFSKVELYKARAEVLKGDIGLRASANYLENLNPGPDQFEDNLIYDRRLQAGLSMDLLRNGLMSNRIKARALETEAVLLENEINALSSNSSDYTLNRNAIIYSSNVQKLALIEHRSQYLSELQTQLNSLLNEHLTTRDKWLFWEARIQQNNQLKLMYTTYNAWFSDIAGNDFPFPQLALPAISINYTGISKSATEETESNTPDYNELKELTLHPVHQIGLSPFVRYNYYDLTGTTNARSFVSLGLSLSAPIDFNREAQSTLFDLEHAPQSAQVSSATNTSMDLLNLYYEFMYKWKQLVDMEGKLTLAKEDLRKVRAAQSIEPELFQPIKAIQAADDWVLIQLELIDLKQQLYLKALQILEKSGATSPKDLIEPVNQPKLSISEMPSIKGLYCWTSPVDERSIDFLGSLLELMETQELYLSFGQDTKWNAQKTSLCRQIVASGGNAHLMIGNNQLIRHSFAPYLNKIFPQALAGTLTSIHLDVEPHTFGDFKEHEDDYLKALSDLYTDAKKVTDSLSMKLSAAVPLHYPLSFYSHSAIDHWVLMAYENVSTDYLVRKIQAIQSQSSAQIKIALRTADFGTIAAMMEFSELLSEKTGLTDYVFHDFESIIQKREAELTTR